MLKYHQFLVYAIIIAHIFCASYAFAASEIETLKQQGDVFFEKKDYDKAIEYFKKAAKLEKNNAEFNNKIGLGYFNKYEYETAIKYFNRAIKADVNFKEARDNIKDAVVAGHLRWIDKQYDFSKVHSILLVPMDITKARAEKTFDTILNKNIKCNIIKQDKRDEVSSAKGDIYIKTDIRTWDTDKYRVAERVYYEGWEEKTIRVPDKNGKMVVKKVRQHKTSSRPFFGSQKHTDPAYDVYHSNVDVLFEVYDSKSDTLIMVYNEKRSKEGGYKQESMYEEMLDKFFGDLGKKIK